MNMILKRIEFLFLLKIMTPQKQHFDNILKEIKNLLVTKTLKQIFPEYSHMIQ